MSAPEQSVAPQDALENAVATSAALLEVMGALRIPISGDFIMLDLDTVEGLHLLAVEQGRNLRACFKTACDTQRKSSREDACGNEGGRPIAPDAGIRLASPA